MYQLGDTTAPVDAVTPTDAAGILVRNFWRNVQQVPPILWFGLVGIWFWLGEFDAGEASRRARARGRY